MEKTGVVRPMRLWQSLLFFLVPGLYALFSQYILIPYLVRLGTSEEYAYNTVLLTVFVLLFFATIIALGVEGWSFNWATVRERLRVRRMDSNAWKWTLSFLVLYLLLGFLLNMLAQFVYDRLGFWPPDADIPLTNIPFLAIVLVANVFSEELWWRGYILPRQELVHGKSAYIVNGILWSLFHMFKWWAVPFMLLRQWMLPFVVQRTKNTTPGILIHLISNGLSILLSIIPLLPV
jgi:membrane protease YdiL (CAAX protease family)